MGLEEIRTNYPDLMGEARRGCTLCGGARVIKAEIKFKTGANEPTVGETITGETSGDTGVLAEIALASGTWRGTATGYFVLTSPTGLDSDGHWGTDGEVLSGSTTGDIARLDGEGSETAYGIMYPESELVEYKGRFYCKPHWNFRFRQQLLDERKIRLEEAKID